MSVGEDGMFKKPSTSSSGMNENDGWVIVVDKTVNVYKGRNTNEREALEENTFLNCETVFHVFETGFLQTETHFLYFHGRWFGQGKFHVFETAFQFFETRFQHFEKDCISSR